MMPLVRPTQCGRPSAADPVRAPISASFCDRCTPILVLHRPAAARGIKPGVDVARHSDRRWFHMTRYAREKIARCSGLFQMKRIRGKPT